MLKLYLTDGECSMEMKVFNGPWLTMGGRCPLLLLVLTSKLCRNSSYLSGKRFRAPMAVSGLQLCGIIPKGLFVHPSPVMLPCHPTCPWEGSMDTSQAQHLQCSPGSYRTLSIPFEITAECLLISLLQFSSAKPHCIQS